LLPCRQERPDQPHDPCSAQHPLVPNLTPQTKELLLFELVYIVLIAFASCPSQEQF